MSSDNTITLGDWLRQAETALLKAGVFLGHGTDNYWDEALHIALPILNIGFDAELSILDRPLAAAEQKTLDGLLEQRIAARVPVAYLTGIAWFARLPFQVDRRVLIPRSPIAELIEAGFEPWLAPIKEEQSTLDILDLCCGGGCIGIAAAVWMPEARVDLADISAEALALAQANIECHGVADRVHGYRGDLFGAVPEGKRYDLIVCNPPYVDAQDMASLPAEYSHEPRLALEAGIDGLDLVKTILSQALDYLKPGGILIVEVGNSAEALEEQYPELPFLWLEFERGGHGVFLLDREQLDEHTV